MQFIELRKHRGCIVINRCLIEGFPEIVRKFLGELLIYQAASEGFCDTVKYWAFHPFFMKVENECECLNYKVYEDVETLKRGKTINGRKYKKGDRVLVSLSFKPRLKRWQSVFSEEEIELRGC